MRSPSYEIPDIEVFVRPGNRRTRLHARSAEVWNAVKQSNCLLQDLV